MILIKNIKNVKEIGESIFLINDILTKNLESQLFQPILDAFLSTTSSSNGTVKELAVSLDPCFSINDFPQKNLLSDFNFHFARFIQNNKNDLYEYEISLNDESICIFLNSDFNSDDVEKLSQLDYSVISNGSNERIDVLYTNRSKGYLEYHKVFNKLKDFLLESSLLQNNLNKNYNNISIADAINNELFSVFKKGDFDEL